MNRSRNKICVRLFVGLTLLFLSANGCGAKQAETQSKQEVKEGQPIAEDARKETGEAADEVAGEEENRKHAQYRIGISMPDMSFGRWGEDGADMKKQLEEAGYGVILCDAQGDIEKQRKDINELLEEDIALLIVGAVDGDGLGDVLSDAAEQSVRVIAYDKLLMDTDAVDYYVSFDHYGTGKAQAEYVISLLGLTEDMVKDGTDKSFTVRILGGEADDLQSLAIYQGMEDTLIAYMWGDTPVLEEADDGILEADVRLEQLWDGTDAGMGDRYVVGLAVGNGACKEETNGKQLFYGNSEREAEITCLLADEILGKGEVSASFLEELDYGCSFDKHSYDNGTGIIPAFLIEAEMIPRPPLTQLR